MTTPSPTRPWLYWSTPLKWIVVFIILLWVFAVLVPFYVIQKPFTLASIQSLTDSNSSYSFSFKAILRTGWYLLSALYLWLSNLSIGLWLLRLLRVPTINILEKIILGTGLGFGFVGLLVLGLGLFGLISWPVLTAMTVILLIPGLKQIMSLWKIRPPDTIPRLPKLYLLVTLFLGLTIALLPPTDWDGLFYHLTGPKLYLQAGQISSGVDIPHLNFPSLFEMHFLTALAMSGAVTAKLLHFVFALMLAGLVYLIAQYLLDLKDGWWAILFLFSMPMVLTLAGWAYNDLALAFFQVGALYGLIRFWGFGNSEARIGYKAPNPLPQSSPPWLIISAIFCGLAMSLKYTSFVAPVSLVWLLLWAHWRKRISFTIAVKRLVTFSGIALIVASPWYIKNLIFTGNPVYPFVFGGQLWDSFRAAAYASSGSGIGFNPLGWFALPYQLTLGIWDANYIDGRTGPIFLMFFPFILVYGLVGVRRFNSTPLNYLLFFALVQYLFWLMGVIWSQGLWQSRLLLPAFVALAPVLAWILQDLRFLTIPQFSLQRFMKLVIGMILLLGVADQIFSEQNRAGWLYYRPWHYLAGTETQESYLQRRLGYYAVAMTELNNQLPYDAVVTFLWEPRSYYCNRDCRPDSILDAFGHVQYMYGAEATPIAQGWRESGITHILIHRLGYDHLLADENTAPELFPNAALLQDLETTHLSLIFDLDGAYQLYKVR